MKNIKNKILFCSLLVVISLVLAGCNKPIPVDKELNGGQTGVSPAAQTEELIMPEDKIEFADPGSDDLGKAVKEMDGLVNSASPSEYSEGDLSDEAVETEVELE